MSANIQIYTSLQTARDSMFPGDIALVNVEDQVRIIVKKDSGNYVTFGSFEEFSLSGEAEAISVVAVEGVSGNNVQEVLDSIGEQLQAIRDALEDDE